MHKETGHREIQKPEAHCRIDYLFRIHAACRHLSHRAGAGGDNSSSRYRFRQDGLADVATNITANLRIAGCQCPLIAAQSLVWPDDRTENNLHRKWLIVDGSRLTTRMPSASLL
jgi:hypothetical protein